MPGHLSADVQFPAFALRCECGARVDADDANGLVELTRLHFGEFHPDLGSNVPADLILAMAEQAGERS